VVELLVDDLTGLFGGCNLVFQSDLVHELPVEFWPRARCLAGRDGRGQARHACETRHGPREPERGVQDIRRSVFGRGVDRLDDTAAEVCGVIELHLELHALEAGGELVQVDAEGARLVGVADRPHDSFQVGRDLIGLAVGERPLRLNPEVLAEQRVFRRAAGVAGGWEVDRLADQLAGAAEQWCAEGAREDEPAQGRLEERCHGLLLSWTPGRLGRRGSWPVGAD